MKIKNGILLFSALISVCLISACSSDKEGGGSKNEGGISFSGTINKRTFTRMASAQWEANDAIGIYMKQTGEDLTTHAISDAKNIKYVTVLGDGKFKAETSSEAILYPASGQRVDFVAYYPFQTTITPSCAYNVDVTNQQDQAGIDLLYSDNAKNMTGDASSVVGMLFSHKLTKVVVNVLPSAEIVDVTGVEVATAGMLTKALFHLGGTTALVPDGMSAGNIVFKSEPKTGGVGVLAEAIILPMPATVGRVFTLTLKGKVYTWPIPDATVFVEGKRYTYDAILSEKEVVITNPNGTIDDWEEVPSGNIEAEFGEALPVILINQTNESLSGVEEGASIILKGSITSITDLVSAKIISKTTAGVETEIDLLAPGTRSSELTLDFEKTIIATSDLESIRIEVEDKNQQIARQEFTVKVGFHSYNILASGSGFTAFPVGVKPFMSASLGASLGYCDAKALSMSLEVGSSPIEVGFSTFNATSNIAFTNMVNINAGKFKHPTCSPVLFWGNRTTVYISKANITRSNFDEVTVAQLKAETALTSASGGIVTGYFTEGATNAILDEAFIYQVKIDGEYKRVIFCLDEIIDKLGTSEVQFSVKMIVEK